jgi:hypothetical protein
MAPNASLREAQIIEETLTSTLMSPIVEPQLMADVEMWHLDSKT